MSSEIVTLDAPTDQPGVLGEVRDVDTGARAVILMPCAYHIEPECMESIWGAAAQFGRDRLRFRMLTRTTVWIARDILVDDWLRNYDAEYAIMLDADMIVPTGTVDKEGRPTGLITRVPCATPIRHDQAKLNFFTRMLSHSSKHGIVGASYFDRLFGAQLQCSMGVGIYEVRSFNDRYRAGQVRGLLDCEWVATGGMRVHRSAFDTVRKNAHRFPEIVPSNQKSYWGFFTPNRVNVGEDVAWCFAPGTYVNTGLIKPIEDVRVGEFVLSHDGSRHEVLDLSNRHYEGEMLEVSGFYSGPVQCTPAHRFFIQRFKSDQPAQWVEAKDIQKGDWLHIPKPAKQPFGLSEIDLAAFLDFGQLRQFDDGRFGYSRTRKTALRIGQTLKITPHLCRLLGYYLADGFVTQGGQHLDFAMGATQTEDIEDLIAGVEQTFGLKAQFNEVAGVARFCLSSKILGELFLGMCGTGAYTKHLPSFWSQLSDEHLGEIINGYWRGDGCFSGGKFSLTTMSLQLAREVQAAILRLGVLAGIKRSPTAYDIRNDISIPARLGERFAKIVKYEHVSKTINVVNPTNFFRETSEEFFVKVRGVSRRSYRGPVFNLKVAGSESYTANLASVHNCARAKLCGITPWLDADLRLLHVGKAYF